MQRQKYVFLLLLCFFSNKICSQEIKFTNEVTKAAAAVLERVIGSRAFATIQLDTIQNTSVNPVYTYEVINGRLYVSGNTTVAICKGFYDYLKVTDQGIVTWSGNHLRLRPAWRQVQKTTVISPYQFHYYFNVVTHGYTTPYWGFERWQKELDWMGLHGMDMPLINGAYEQIVARVFKKLGIKDAVLANFFTGPAYHPWSRMGNITGWDDRVPASYNPQQLKLTHQVLNRMKELGMHPIIPAFAGFVPKEITALYPDAPVKEIIWGGFSELKKNRAHILLPNNPLFIKIGKMYIEEWEKEFGKGKYYLADSFNEMDVPPSPNEDEQLKQLENYGGVVYESIKAANPDAIWVMQGWTFPYHKDSDGHIFWTEKRLSKLVEKVPDDKIIFLDLANDYNRDIWKIDPSWKTYHGFFNKAWVYSFIPNMGGKTARNGILKTYAEAPEEALNYQNRGKLIGFGFAPEGIENNEIIYELLSDVGYTNKKINLKQWIPAYCEQRYGLYPDAMKKAYQNLLNSSYGSFTDHPRFRYQLSANGKMAGTVDNDQAFFTAVKEFLACSPQLSGSQLYRNDVFELTAQFLSLKADSIIQLAIVKKTSGRANELDKAYRLMETADRLLLSHPNDRLKRWTDMASAWGNTPAEKQYYAMDAKRLITTWGGTLNDYAARMWGGLISSYYVGRMKYYYNGRKEKSPTEMARWEEHWINTNLNLNLKPFSNPVKTAIKAVAEF